jgi:signal transduction histidine kinase
MKTHSDSIRFFQAKNDFHLAARNEDSITYYSEKFIEVANTPESYKSIIILCRRVGHFYEESGAFEKSLTIHQKGLDVAEAYQDPMASSDMLIDISQTYRIFHNYEKAIEYGQRASKVLEDNNVTDLKAKALALDITAAAFTENRQLDSALVYHQKVLDFLPELDSMDVKNTIVNIGYTYMEVGELEKSRIYTERGLALHKPLKNYYITASIYTNLGMYGNRANRYKYALRMFDSAIFYVEKSKYIETLFWIYEERAQVYQKQGNFKKAYEDALLLQQVKDSVFKVQRDKSTQEMETKYETAKKEKELAIQRQNLLDRELQLKNRNFYIILISSVLVILIILTIGFYKRQQFKRSQLQKELELKESLAQIKTQNKLQEQRLEISRDLHDNIGSQLTFIISSIDNLKYVSKDINEKLKEKLGNISSFTFDTIHQLRDTIWAMNKNEIPIDEFYGRILSYVDKVKSVKPELAFNTTNTISDTVVFSSVEGMNLFRIVQESINNSIKHAQAQRIDISFSQEEKQLTFVIKDDGKGFDLQKVEMGNGLSNIENRVSAINGKVFIQSEINQGTQIRIQLTT